MHGLKFGEAIEALKRGDAVRRAGWNGKGMAVFMRDGVIDPDGPDGKKSKIDGVPAHLFGPARMETVTHLPTLAMKTATGSIVVGWLASQTDMLAEDWEIVE